MECASARSQAVGAAPSNGWRSNREIAEDGVAEIGRRFRCLHGQSRCTAARDPSVRNILMRRARGRTRAERFDWIWTCYVTALQTICNQLLAGCSDRLDPRQGGSQAAAITKRAAARGDGDGRERVRAHLSTDPVATLLETGLAVAFLSRPWDRRRFAGSRTDWMISPRSRFIVRIGYDVFVATGERTPT